MVPEPKATVDKIESMTPKLSADSVVISGISGCYPKSAHIKDLDHILYNKVDPLSHFDHRWIYNHPEVPTHSGIIPDLDRFDPQFFKFNNQLSKWMDPMSRKLKEHTYRAIYDAGLSADHVSGKNIGVYLGSSSYETEKVVYFDTENITANTLPGCSKAMFANRISYWLNLKGPSMTVDDACASSMVALEQAYQAIKCGDCEAAIVGGASITLHPQSVVHYGRVVPLSKTGQMKPYDQDADGGVKSEAISVIFLQKAQHALRIYAEVVQVKNEFDPMVEVGIYRNPTHLANFMQVFYQEANVSPDEIEYFEGFGSGILEVDKAELNAVEEVFCKNRNNPLLVGSVASNVGHTEGSSGLCGITKVLLGYHKGLLAANLHCSNPRQDVAAIRDGRMRILTEHAPFRRSYAAVNGLSITGINSHCLLRGIYIPKKTTEAESKIVRLVTISGRQEFSVQKIIDDLSNKPIDVEELALLHNIYEAKNTGHLARGYVILDSDQEGDTVHLASNVEHYDDIKRPLWFVYSGMGSQWAGMGKQLMCIPTFAAAIQRCHRVLEPKGIDIKHIITSMDKTIYNNILHSFVGIAAVQIGLTDVLLEMGIVPDKIIGHSVGELGCGYADGCFTAEEMILSAYSRGLVSVQTKFIRGSMAAVGIGYEQAVKVCPPEIEVACHNGPESCTISGPAECMREFVSKLTAQGIFAKEVPCSNIAYHSRYIAEAGPKLLEYLSEVIKNPKRRSERWISTSVPQESWSEENAQYCSAWYHTNNLLSPVLFEESSRLVPAGAVLVEVAPHGLLQAILKRSLHPDCRHIPLTKRGHPDGTIYFLEAIGKLFIHGYNPKIRSLYPEIQFPVSTETPGLSHLVEWNYSDKFALPLYRTVRKEWATMCTSYISIHDDESIYLQGNILKGKNLYPFSAALVAIWDTFAMSSGAARSEMSVQFRDVHLFAQPVLLDQRHLELKVTILIGSGEFEVVTPFSKVATGTINQYTEQLSQYESATEDKTSLNSKDIYKLFQEKDYSYAGDFVSIYKSNYSFTEAQLLWNDNWVSLIDGMLQMNSLRRDHDTVSQPSHIHNLIVDLKTHSSLKMYQVDGKTVIPAVTSVTCDYTRCGGILLERVKFFDFPLFHTNMLQLQPVELDPHSDKININNDTKSTPYDLTLQIYNTGDLKSLSWVGADDVLSSTPSDVFVKVQYAGISVYDVNVATGVYSSKKGYLGKNVYGMEYSGITINSGCRVMGVVRGGAASSRVRAVPGLTWPAPAHWSLEDAATVPLAYCMAFYCLSIKSQLFPGMKIFVHGGSGALGQAVISIALAHQCKVFTTVADDHKKKFLLGLFPDLTEQVIGCSQESSFADLILQATNGEGCDIVISCATGDLKNMTLECCAFCGIYLDIAQAHVEDTFAYGMNYMTLQRSYIQVDFFSIFENEKYIKMLQVMMSEGIARGYVKPLSRVTYAAQEAPRAFRLLAASQHRGRLLLRLGDCLAPAHTRLTCSPFRYQLVICREENFSLQFVDRLIKRGAKKILLHHPQPSSLISYKIATWQTCGIEVKSSSIDLRNVDKTQELLQVYGENIEGLFIICQGHDRDNYIMNVLKEASSPFIKHFAVITTTYAVENLYVCEDENQYPTTIFSLNNIQNMCNGTTLSRCDIIDAIESSLCSLHQKLNVSLNKIPKPSLLEEVMNKADLNVPDNVGEDTTLQEMGLNDRFVKAIAILLQCSYHISIPDEKIPKLTVRQLTEFERHSKESDYEEADGLSALISHVDQDELLGTASIVVLPTLVKCLSVKDSEVDMSQQYLWIVPGVEGHHGRFRALCARLKLPALVLQPDGEHRPASVQQAARRYVQVLKRRTNLEKFSDFYLLGYESGVLTALEMAALLEQEGLTGTVFCVGGGPDEVILNLKNTLKHLDTEEKLQKALIHHIIALMSPDELGDTDTLLEGGLTPQDKFEMNLRVLMKNSPQTTLYARALIEGAFSHIKQTLQYEGKPLNLRSQIVVIRPKSMFKNKTNLNGGSLSKDSITYELEVPLMYCIEYPKCACLVNAHLSTEIIESYKQQNRCESYIPIIDMFTFDNNEE